MTLMAPWTAEQVAHLNTYQQSGRMHPFTCGRRDQHRDNPGILVATETGWHCPADGCDYQQDWAHAFMAAPLPPSPLHDALDMARAGWRCGEQALVLVDQIRTWASTTEHGAAAAEILQLLDQPRKEAP